MLGGGGGQRCGFRIRRGMLLLEELSTRALELCFEVCRVEGHSKGSSMALNMALLQRVLKYGPLGCIGYIRG